LDERALQLQRPTRHRGSWPDFAVRARTVQRLERQSAARELWPQGIHVVHFVIDGGVKSPDRPVPADKPDSLLDPDAIAQTYLDVLRQPRTAWSREIELRPWVETF
jgi:hypothetical protein